MFRFRSIYWRRSGVCIYTHLYFTGEKFREFSVFNLVVKFNIPFCSKFSSSFKNIDFWWFWLLKRYIPCKHSGLTSDAVKSRGSEIFRNAFLLVLFHSKPVLSKFKKYIFWPIAKSLFYVNRELRELLVILEGWETKY